MTKDELRNSILGFCEDAEKELREKRKAVITEQVFLRKHNYNLESQAFAYKDEAFSEADYILFRLKENIFKLFDENESKC